MFSVLNQRKVTCFGIPFIYYVLTISNIDLMQLILSVFFNYHFYIHWYIFTNNFWSAKIIYYKLNFSV